MELQMSIAAMVISLASVIISIAIYVLGISRERKQATLDAFNVLQEQVFDKLNQYTVAEICKVCDDWKQVPGSQAQFATLSEAEKEKANKTIDEYRALSGLLARIEHFALGVNTGIYDARIAERAATTYLVMLYRSKLKTMIETKHSGDRTVEYYAEFRKLVEQIEKIEK